MEKLCPTSTCSLYSSQLASFLPHPMFQPQQPIPHFQTKAYFCFSAFVHAVPFARNSLFPYSFFKSLSHVWKSLGQFVHLLPGLPPTSTHTLLILDLDRIESCGTLAPLRHQDWTLRAKAMPQQFPCSVCSVVDIQ